MKQGERMLDNTGEYNRASQRMPTDRSASMLRAFFFHLDLPMSLILKLILQVTFISGYSRSQSSCFQAL